jgi:DNA repair exonuclease SbcCD nuclease subunit
MVDLAIQAQVHVLCLSGDVVDAQNRFWEAIGPLEQGIRRLADHNVRTVAVSGNHDFDVLARLADQLPREHFVLLGRGGQWERLTLDRPDQVSLHLDGWSFPTQRVSESPLHSYSLARDPATPILGMVHGDLDVGNSPYAPLELARLRKLPPGAWLLGHLHAPRLISGPPWILYPGSPQAFDPGETGAHGPWLLEVSRGTLGIPEQRPLSSVWYGQLTIDLSGVQNEAQLETLILGQMRQEADRIASLAGPHFVHASVRVQLIGVTPLAHSVASVAKRITDDLSLPAGNGSMTVEKTDIQTIPPIDLAEHAKTRSAPGAVASLLLELDGPEVSPEVADLIDSVRRRLKEIEKRTDFVQLPQREITETMARQVLQAQCRALLTQLETQTP